jgi:hypothetical protein
LKTEISRPGKSLKINGILESPRNSLDPTVLIMLEHYSTFNSTNSGVSESKIRAILEFPV